MLFETLIPQYLEFTCITLFYKPGLYNIFPRNERQLRQRVAAAFSTFLTEVEPKTNMGCKLSVLHRRLQRLVLL